MTEASNEFKAACDAIQAAGTLSEVKQIVDRLDDAWKRQDSIMREDDWVTLSMTVMDAKRRIESAAHEEATPP